MVDKDLIPAVDQAIAALKAARKLLVMNGRQSQAAAKSTAKAGAPAKGTRGTRVLSAESRQRIVEAQQRRWAAVRKAAKKAAKKTA